jgi:ubiquinone/menaquinone biosynthesis C-methylase UbiE
MVDFLSPNQILSQLDLKSTMVAADFGCGGGGWTVPLARILRDGRVWAVDIQSEVLSALESKLQLHRIYNVKKVVADIERGVPQISSSSVDLVLMSNLLFQVDDKMAVFKEAERVLKEGGKALVVDWVKNAPFGPKEGTVSKEEAREIAESAGFRFEKELPAGGYHYALLFVKS